MGCRSGKSVISAESYLPGAASSFARWKNSRGELAADIYSYRCPDCRFWHLTRSAFGPHGEPNRLVHRAAPEELQRWAMPPDAEALR